MEDDCQRGEEMKTIFEKIIDRELPATILLETDRIIVIQDIYPQAPHHYLVISKKAIPCVQKMSEEDMSFYMPQMMAAVQELAKKFKIENYRLIINNGPEAGQTVFHLHMHFLAGKTMGEKDFA